jgi:predicted MPP superfamily phosphohydrolase
MKNIYIGDIHGLTVWEDIVKQHPDADNIVFIGDYFDSFDISGIEQLFNVENIVRFKKESKSNVYLLIGNHDHHYWPGVKEKGMTSGYQSKMAHQFEYFFRENEKEFQMAVAIGNVLCTHAGVSNQFLKEVGYWAYDYKDESHIVEFLNDLFKYKPNEFGFNAYSGRHYGLAYSDPYGNNEGQSPIWIRPRALQRANQRTELKKMYTQVVGHTQQPSIDIKGKTTGGKYYYIDTLPKGEYLIEIDGEFEVGKI